MTVNIERAGENYEVVFVIISQQKEIGGRNILMALKIRSFNGGFMLVL